MSTNSKIILWIVIIIVVIGGIWYVWSRSSSNTDTGTSQAASAATTTSQPVLSSGTSDQNLNSDLTQIDAQTAAANSDSASIDQSFNDQPIQQAQ